MKLNKRHMILIAVLIVLAAVVVYQLQNPYVQPTTDQLTYTGKTAEPVKAVRHEMASPEPENRSRSLVSQFLDKPNMSGKTHKNLFSIYTPPVKKRQFVKPVIKKPEPKPVEPALPKRDFLAEAKEYISSYQFYGSYSDKGKKAVFLSKNKQL